MYFSVLIISCYVGTLGSKQQGDKAPDFTSGSSGTKSQFVWRAIFILYKQCSSLARNWKWADVHLLSLNATYLTDCCNKSADVLSLSKRLSIDSQKGDSAHLNTYCRQEVNNFLQKRQINNVVRRQDIDRGFEPGYVCR